ncbi:hypothetical protein JY97_14455 [Alkalispirochaeta odontotermitis]|nr:hypothetical protein JY97_14455 [Alkalispirochaeta odontotermitis]CAB1083043.1 hypothetical protein D1AOALGA4SA_10628 [Olavius algarvensis Delta 1 endosymbiont]
MTEDRCQRTEDRSQKWEFGMRPSTSSDETKSEKKTGDRLWERFLTAMKLVSRFRQYRNKINTAL